MYSVSNHNMPKVGVSIQNRKTWLKLYVASKHFEFPTEIERYNLLFKHSLQSRQVNPNHFFFSGKSPACHIGHPAPVCLRLNSRTEFYTIREEGQFKITWVSLVPSISSASVSKLWCLSVVLMLCSWSFCPFSSNLHQFSSKCYQFAVS